jgi:hypothetical protein
MTAQDYQVYFPYGATTAPYSKERPHRGEDRCNVWGVDVVVGNTLIGRTGATGLVYDAQGQKGTKAAAHLHIQEWQDNVLNTRKPQHSFGGGVVTNTGVGSEWGNFVTISRDGWHTTYCHLSSINVQAGQIAGADMDKDATIKALTKQRDEVAEKLMASEKLVQAVTEQRDDVTNKLIKTEILVETALKGNEVTQRLDKIEATLSKLVK